MEMQPSASKPITVGRRSRPSPPDLTPWASPDVPRGYNTVLGYLAATNPEALALIEDPVEDTRRDGWGLTSAAAFAGRRIHRVEAPPVVRERGFPTVNAYPVALLRERFG